MKHLLLILLTAFTLTAFSQGSDPILKTVTLQNAVSAADSAAPVGAKTKIRYDQAAGKLRFWNHLTAQWYSFNTGPSVAYGTSQQIPYVSATNNSFNYSSKFRWDNTNNNLIAAGNGAVFSGSPTNSIHFGSNSTVKASWSITNAEESTINSNSLNSLSSGWHHTIGSDTDLCSGCQSVTMGLDHSNKAAVGFISGIGGRTNWTNPVGATVVGSFVHGMMSLSGSGLKPASIPYVTAAQGAVNISRNTSAQTDGNGALCVDCGIYSGVNGHIPSTSEGSVIIGGSGIVARASDDNQVYVPNLNVVTAPLNDDALTQLLARDGTTGQIKYRTSNSLTAGLTDQQIGFGSGGNLLTGSSLLTFVSGASQVLIGSNALTLDGSVGAIFRSGPISLNSTILNIGSSSAMSFVSGSTITFNPTTFFNINLGSDATGDTYYRDASGHFVRRAIGSSGQFLQVSGGLPVWGAAPVTNPAGSNTHIQFNSSGGFGADASFRWTGTSLVIGNTTVSGSSISSALNFDVTASGGNLNLAASGGSVRINGLVSSRIPIIGAAGAITDDADLTFSGGNTLVAANATVSGALINSALTSGRVPFITTAGQFTDAANFTFGSGNLAVPSALTVGTSNASRMIFGSGTLSISETSGGSIQISTNGSTPIMTLSTTGMNGTNGVTIQTSASQNITLNPTGGELIFTITRTNCSGAPSGAVYNNAGALQICP